MLLTALATDLRAILHEYLVRPIRVLDQASGFESVKQRRVHVPKVALGQQTAVWLSLSTIGGIVAWRQSAKRGGGIR